MSGPAVDPLLGLDFAPTSGGRGSASVEASSLRWAPGVVPLRVRADVGGVLRPFGLVRADEGSFVYRSVDGTAFDLVVFND